MDNDNQKQPLSIAAARQLFKSLDAQRDELSNQFNQSLNYYDNKNDITRRELDDKTKIEEENNPLRNADNRVSSNFQQILVDQKVSYMGSVPPAIDLESETLNKQVAEKLGDDWPRTLQRLITDASLAGVAWLHLWEQEDNLKIAVVPPDQVTPIYGDSINHELVAIRRTYVALDIEAGSYYIHDEYWNDKQAVFFKRPKGKGYNDMLPDNRLTIFDSNLPDEQTATNVFDHNLGQVPFVPFFNNSRQKPDLIKYKGLIDAYDLIYNGFLNDVQDVQQVILILTNYGGADLQDFMKDLRRHKAIKIEQDEPGDKSGVDTLSIDIPVEARNSLLDRTMDSIYFQGQGVNPAKLELGTNLSGVAMKLLYGPLELKAGNLETEFRASINTLIRFILRYLNVANADTMAINQKWTRAAVQNQAEQADVAAKVASFTSAENLAKANPVVDDWAEELKLRSAETDDEYSNDAAQADLDNDDDE